MCKYLSDSDFEAVYEAAAASAKPYGKDDVAHIVALEMKAWDILREAKACKADQPDVTPFTLCTPDLVGTASSTCFPPSQGSPAVHEDGAGDPRVRIWH